MARADVRIELNSAGVQQVLQSAGVAGDLAARAQRIAASAGEGFASSSTTGRRRALAMVWADTAAARRAEATEAALTRAIDAGR